MPPPGQCILTETQRCQNTLINKSLSACPLWQKSIKRSTPVKQGRSHTDRNSTSPCWTGLISVSIWTGLHTEGFHLESCRETDQWDFYNWLNYQISTMKEYVFLVVQFVTVLPPMSKMGANQQDITFWVKFRFKDESKTNLNTQNLFCNLGMC